MQRDLWIDIRLNKEHIDFLNEAISKENKKSLSEHLAGNISKSEIIEDKDNWFLKSVVKELSERLFYRDWDNFSKYHIEVEVGVPLPEFKMNRFWVNYQKKHEFNPIHDHNGLFSFVVFMKIPTHWKDQHALPISVNSNAPVASDFAFVWSEKDKESCTPYNIPLSSEDEGRMLFFPGWLQHMVYPFYECEEERITISGNIIIEDPNVNYYEEKKNMLKMMEYDVQQAKDELKQMK